MSVSERELGSWIRVRRACQKKPTRGGNVTVNTVVVSLL